MREILRVAEEQEIRIERYQLGENILGIYCKISSIKTPFIVLNKSLSDDGPRTRVVAAHELGHHFTTVGTSVYWHCNYQKTICINKIEKAAMKWAGKFLIPYEDLIDFTKNNRHDPYILAERFNVTLEFMVMRLELFVKEYESRHDGSLHQRMHIQETTRQLAGSFSTI